MTSVGARSVRVQVRGMGNVRCTLRGALWALEKGETRPVAVGDRVDLTVDGEAGVIEAVHERRNSFHRPQTSGRQSGAGRSRPARYGKAPPLQVIAANIDRVLVVAALNDPPFRPGLVDRFCVAAAVQNLSAVLVLNKVDLTGDRELVAPWRDSGYPVLATSVISGEGIDELSALMSDGISLLVGHSGVGKSSLLNAVEPGLRLGVGAVNEHHGRGRHTTTKVTLLPLTNGGLVVDSPGIRELALSQVSPTDLARLYPGFGDLPHGCRFSNCRHEGEPSCAVLAAVEAGELPDSRHQTYLRILADLKGDG